MDVVSPYDKLLDGIHDRMSKLDKGGREMVEIPHDVLFLNGHLDEAFLHDLQADLSGYDVPDDVFASVRWPKKSDRTELVIDICRL